MLFNPLDGSSNIDELLAGGAATNGHQRMLDTQPANLHERGAVFLGSKNEVEHVTSYHA